MKEFSLPKEQIILGGLLGDSSFNLKRKTIAFSQCEKQLEYVQWKYSFFDTKAEIHSVYNARDGKNYLRYYFVISKKYIGNNLINFIEDNLYSDKGVKTISLEYLNQLSPLGLAVWWMDDGNISLTKDGGNRYGKLSTHCFSYDEHIIMKNYFKQKWNIDVSIRPEKGHFFLRININSLKKFIKLVYPYITQIQSMIYKVDLKYKYLGRVGEDFIDTYKYIERKKIA